MVQAIILVVRRNCVTDDTDARGAGNKLGDNDLWRASVRDMKRRHERTKIKSERMAWRVFHIDAGVLATIARESKAVKLRMKYVFRLALDSQY